MKLEMNEIGELHDAWIRAKRDGRTNDLFALCGEDVVTARPGCRPIQGLEAVSAFLETSATPIDAIIDELKIKIMGRLAVKRARFATLPPRAIEPVHSWHIWVLRPWWKITYIIWVVDT